MGFVKDTFDALTGRGAEKASRQAAQTSADAQMEALNYLREQEAIPQQFREGALTRLGGLFGLEGGDPDAMSQIRQNPIYQATLGQLPQQEEAILRSQSATGALRSSGTEQMLAENQRMNQLSALQNTMGGLQGLAGLQSYAPQIAQGMTGIGQTLAQGQIAGAQARQQGIGQTVGMGLNALALMGTGGGSAAAGGMTPSGAGFLSGRFSDIRLKDNIQPVGERYGHAWYTWDWNEKAKDLGLSGSAEGVLAQEVATTNPDAVGVDSGYLTVNYEKLGVA